MGTSVLFFTNLHNPECFVLLDTKQPDMPIREDQFVNSYTITEDMKKPPVEIPEPVVKRPVGRKSEGRGGNRRRASPETGATKKRKKKDSVLFSYMDLPLDFFE